MRRIALLLGLSATLAGCGGGGYGSGAGTTSGSTTASTAMPAAAAKTVTVSETEYSLTPNVVHVDRPSTIAFKVRNIGHVAHALEVEGHGIHQELDAIQPGQSATLTVHLTKSGSYEMYCPIDGHEAKGMKGVVSVAGSAATGTGGQTTTGGTSTEKSGGYGY